MAAKRAGWGRCLCVVAAALGVAACGSDASTGGASRTTSPAEGGGGSGNTGGSTATGGGGTGDTGGTTATGGGGSGGTTATGAGGSGSTGGTAATGGGGSGGTTATGGGGSGGISATGGNMGGGSIGGGGDAGGGTGGAAGSTSTGAGGDAGAGGSGSGGGACQSSAECDDGVYCNGEEACIQGACSPGSSPCDDGIACTLDMCEEAGRACSHTPVDAACDNGVACDGAETCSPVLGCLSMGATCDDGIACTTDLCDPGTGSCVHLPNAAACSDGLFCNGVETCDPVNGAPDTGCVAGTPPACSDGIACTFDACNEATDSCDHLPDDAACSDGLFCNGAEVCTPGIGCQAGTLVICDDGLSCTVDACDDALEGCTHVPNHAACDDGLSCNGAETCSAAGAGPSGCVAGTPIPCAADAIPCTVDACNEATKECEHTPVNGLCPGGQFCVVAAGGCSAAPPCQTDAECDDGDACNGVETCNVVCQPGTPVDCEDSAACTLDTCDPATGACSHSPIPGFCDDGVACNGMEVCNPAAGGCAPGQPFDCDDGVECTFDSCVEPGSCVHTPQDALCDDEDLCNGLEVCTPGGCQASAPFVCPDDGIACTTEVCDPVLNACRVILDHSLCPCGQTCSETQGCGSYCVVSTCQGKVYACGDCVDNDGDCAIDSADTQCLGPCDNTEDSFYGGIPGQNNSPCKSDCYFDQDTGSGNDGCYWSHKCDPLEVAPHYPPEGSQCAYNPNANIPGYGGDCMSAFAMQSIACMDYCGPLTPNGCDCFGCCEIPGAPTTVWLGSESPSGTGSCTLANVGNPALCKPCTQVTACLNACEPCEICVGKPTLPPECGGQQECPSDLDECGQPGQAPCHEGYTCITGCCQPNPE